MLKFQIRLVVWALASYFCRSETFNQYFKTCSNTRGSKRKNIAASNISVD